MRDEITKENIDICFITKEEGYKLLSDAEIQVELNKL